MPLSRRSLLTAGGAIFGTGTVAAAVGIQTEVLPGRSWFYQHLGINGSAGAAPDVEIGPVVSGSFASAARGVDVGWSVAHPPGMAGRRLPVVVALHGRGESHTNGMSRDHEALPWFLAAGVAAGVPPFAIATVDGSETYWHDRASGDRAGTMVVSEFLPLLARRGLDTSRVGFLGWSMGGFGALHFAMQLGASRVAAACALSPAIWPSYDQTTPGSFDDADDFSANTPFGRQSDLEGIPVRIDCGDSDPFYSNVRAYREGFTTQPAGGFALGAHNSEYWRRVLPAHIVLLGTSLAA